VIVPVRKFGEILVSRPAGREAALIIRSSFVPADPSEPIQLDFDGVKVVGPNATVRASLETLAQG